MGAKQSIEQEIEDFLNEGHLPGAHKLAEIVKRMFDYFHDDIPSDDEHAGDVE